jgi:hypothetical protein
MRFDIGCQRRVEPTSVGRLIPPRAGIESPFLRTLAPGARLLLRHSASMPPPPFKSDAPVLHQNSAPVRAWAGDATYPSQIREPCVADPQSP